MSEVLSPLPAPARRLPAALVDNIWKPGQSGNPTGKSGEYQRCQSLCKAASYEAAEEVISLGKTCDDPRVRYMANTWVYERAWGKVKDYDPKSEGNSVPVFDPKSVTPEQLQIIKAAMNMLTAAMSVVEVHEPDSE